MYTYNKNVSLSYTYTYTSLASCISRYYRDWMHVYIVTDCAMHDDDYNAGALGMYFKLDGCEFTNNRGHDIADEYGAALAVSLYHIFRQRMTAQRHDIINW